jgi:hypothetical protein
LKLIWKNYSKAGTFVKRTHNPELEREMGALAQLLLEVWLEEQRRDKRA